MKLLATTIAMVLAATLVAPKTETYDLTIQVDGIRNDNGYIMVALHDGTSDFPDSDPFMAVAGEAENGSIELIIKDVPIGEYAIALMHDENGNEQFDTTEYGMPLEGFGFSNNPEPQMGPATWSEASFDVERDEAQSITLIYLNN